MKAGNGNKSKYQKDENEEKGRELGAGIKKKGILKRLMDLYSPFLPVCLATEHFIPGDHRKKSSPVEPKEE